MKQMKHFAILLVIVFGVGLMSSCYPKGTSTKETTPIETTPTASAETYGAKSAMADDSLTIDKMLQYAIQDEYLARSQYESFVKAFEDKPPFTNIMNTEVSHIEELKKLFTSQTLDISEDQSMEYLVKADSYQKALQISSELEQANVDMYQKFLEMDLPDDIFATFSMLRTDSMMHSEEFKKYRISK